MKRILVTGGLGFIGIHLTRALLRDADQPLRIHIVDDLSSNPLPPDVVYRHWWQNDSRISLQLGEIGELARTGQLPDCDEIYHLASILGTTRVLDHAGDIVTSIVLSSASLLDYAERTQARLVFVSTSEVYGGGANGYCTEEAPRLIKARPSPRLEYPAGKTAVEVMMQSRCLGGRLNGSLVRPFNVAGPCQSGLGGFVVPRFVAQALNDEDLTVYGSGKQFRAFSHVEDVAEALKVVMKRGGNGEAYNIGNPDNRTTILDFAHQVIERTGSRSGVRYVDPKSIYGELFEDAEDKFPAGNKLAELGFLPQLRLSDIIDDSARWLRECDAQSFECLAGFLPKRGVART